MECVGIKLSGGGRFFSPLPSDRVLSLLAGMAFVGIGDLGAGDVDEAGGSRTRSALRSG